jgi:hypothetical protein
MKKLLCLGIALLPLALIGCGSSGSAENEATLRKELSGPPMLHPGQHHPGAANKAKAAAGGGGATAGQPPATGQ